MSLTFEQATPTLQTLFSGPLVLPRVYGKIKLSSWGANEFLQVRQLTVEDYYDENGKLVQGDIFSPVVHMNGNTVIEEWVNTDMSSDWTLPSGGD